METLTKSKVYCTVLPISNSNEMRTSSKFQHLIFLLFAIVKLKHRLARSLPTTKICDFFFVFFLPVAGMEGYIGWVAHNTRLNSRKGQFQGGKKYFLSLWVFCTFCVTI